HQLLFNLFGLLGCLICSVLVHRLAHQGFIAAAGAVLLIAGFAGLLLLPELAVIWSSTAGFGSGINVVVALSLFGLRTRHHDEAAALSGMAQSVGFAVAAVGPIAIGAIHDASRTWETVLIGLIAVAVVQALVGFLASRDRTIPSVKFRPRRLAQ